jgi:hypothetical protein
MGSSSASPCSVANSATEQQVVGDEPGMRSLVHLLVSSDRRRRRHLALAATVLVAVGGSCGGETAAPTSTTETEASLSTIVAANLEVDATMADVAETLPRPDADWTSTIIAAYDDFLGGDLDRNLAFLDAAEASPELEVELYVAYIRTVSDAISDVIARYPDPQADSDLGRAAVALRDALEDRRDQLDAIAADLEAVSGEVQAELESGDDARYAEWRTMLAEDPTAEACFALQTELRRADLGLLRCIPGPVGEPPEPDSTTALPDVDLGPDALPLTIELDFDLDADEPAGTFELVAGGTELGCRSGTWIDTGLSTDMIELTKELTCTDGANAGTFTLVQRQDGSDVWLVTDATADFVGLAGTGTFAFDPATTTETITGRFALP